MIVKNNMPDYLVALYYAARRAVTGMRDGGPCRRALWPLGLLFVLLLVAAPHRPLLADTPILSFDPADPRVTVSEQFTVDIRVEDVQNLYGLELRLVFNPDIVHVVDADPDEEGIQIASSDFLVPDFQVKNEADNENGTVWYAMSQMAPRDPANGSGVLVSILFEAVGAGVTQLDLLEASMVDPDGIALDAEVASGTVTVETVEGVVPEQTIPPEPTPTETEAPTRTARPTFTPEATTAVDAPSPTSTAAGAYPGATATPRPTATSPAGVTPAAATATSTPGGYPGPVTTPAAQASPTAAATAPGAYPGATATEAAPSATREDATVAAPTATGPAEATAPAEPVAPEDPTAESGGLAMLESTIVPEVAAIVPTLEPVPTVPSTRVRSNRLIPRDMFICGMAGFTLVTLGLFVYLVRRDRQA